MALEILRANMPYGRLGDDEIGTFFIGYCRTPAITERMLENMFSRQPSRLQLRPSARFLDGP